MLKLRTMLVALGIATAAPAALPATAPAAVVAEIGGVEGGGAFTWVLQYDDETRLVTTTGNGTGFCLVTVKVTNTITRDIAFYPSQGATSINADLASRMAEADFTVVASGSPVTLASGVVAAQVRRIVGKAGSLGGLESQVEWSRA